MYGARKVAFYTLGCKLNFSESSAIAKDFEAVGYERTGFEDEADVYIINTCSVTDNANQKCRKVIRQARRRSPDAKIAVIGCYAQLEPDEIADIPGVDLVLGASEKFNVADHISRGHVEKKVEGKALIYTGDIQESDFYVSAHSGDDRTRTFLKVQDGCDYKCTFCTIPLARGKSRSDTVQHVVKQAGKIAREGIKEVVLTGVNIGDFGKNKNRRQSKRETFYDLVQALDAVKGIERFRISSIEPNLLSDDIISFVAASKRFVPHFHIPLQSGSDSVLKRMKRRYLSPLYQSRVEMIKSLMPECCIGVDVITGFPGETDAEFEQTYRLLNELDVSYLHVFSYSGRPNTAAIAMQQHVPAAIKHERTQRLRMLSDKKRRYFYRQFLNTTRKVLFESENKNGLMHGFTDNYIKVQTPFDENLINQTKMVKLEKLAASGHVEVSNSYSAVRKKKIPQGQYISPNTVKI